MTKKKPKTHRQSQNEKGWGGRGGLEMSPHSRSMNDFQNLFLVLLFLYILYSQVR